MARQDRIRVEWDPRKSDQNRRKHGIDFGFAMLVFYDPLKSIEIEGHEHGETRWRTVGEIDGRVFVVSHTVREEDDIEIIRIISARKASRRERQKYEEAP
ncbi:MAG TPA: BrnT family toxin [Rhizomicrobium sp.]